MTKDAQVEKVRKTTERAPPSPQSGWVELHAAERDYWKPHDDERLTDMKWRRRTRLVISILAVVIPVGLLLCMLWAAALFPRGIFAGESMWPQIVFISGTFLTFIFVFGALVRGAFADSRDDKDASRPNILREMGERVLRNSSE